MNNTLMLIGLCFFVTLFFFAAPLFADFLVYSGRQFVDGAFWTLVTALFVHANLVHLIGNMVFLYVFGNVVEDSVGGKLMITAFFVGGVGSFLISTLYYGYDCVMIGASAAIFTLAAVSMLIKPLKQSLLFFFMPLGLVAILLFIFNLFAVHFSLGGNVGYAAHVTGFLIGIPFGIALSEGKWMKNLGITILLLIAFVALVYLIRLLFALLL